MNRMAMKEKLSTLNNVHYAYTSFVIFEVEIEKKVKKVKKIEKLKWILKNQ